MPVKLQAMWTDFQAWLDAHPWWKGLFVTIEATLSGVIVSLADDYVRGNLTFTHDGLRKMGAFALGAVAIAVRNYVRPSPKQVQTSNAPTLPVASTDVPTETKVVGQAAGNGK